MSRLLILNNKAKTEAAAFSSSARSADDDPAIYIFSAFV